MMDFVMSMEWRAKQAILVERLSRDNNFLRTAPRKMPNYEPLPEAMLMLNPMDSQGRFLIDKVLKRELWREDNE